MFENTTQIQKRFDQGIRDRGVNGVKVTVVVDGNKALIRLQSSKVVSHDIMRKIVLDVNKTQDSSVQWKRTMTSMATKKQGAGSLVFQ